MDHVFDKRPGFVVENLSQGAQCVVRKEAYPLHLPEDREYEPGVKRGEEHRLRGDQREREGAGVVGTGRNARSASRPIRRFLFSLIGLVAVQSFFEGGLSPSCRGL